MVKHRTRYLTDADILVLLWFVRNPLGCAGDAAGGVGLPVGPTSALVDDLAAAGMIEIDRQLAANGPAKVTLLVYTRQVTGDFLLGLGARGDVIDGHVENR